MILTIVIVCLVGGGVIGYIGGRAIENQSWLTKIGKKMDEMDSVIKNLKPPVK